MSSLRPAKIAAALLRVIGGSLAEPSEPAGSPCSCEACEQAWRKNQSPEEVSRVHLATRRRLRVD